MATPQMQFEFPSAAWGISLVDITNTGVTRGDSKERNQQRNWETVLQAAGLLTQVVILQEPQLTSFTKEHDFTNSRLYDYIGHKHKFKLQMMDPNINIWMFAIGSEHEGVFGTKLERLHEVFDMVPVIPELDETIELHPGIFSTTDIELVNIQFFPAKHS